MRDSYRAGRRWAAAAAILVFLVTGVPAVRPGWFVEPTGHIMVLGGPAVGASLALGLLLGARLAWLFAVTCLGLAVGAFSVLLPTGRAPAVLTERPAFAALVLAMFVAFAILVMVPSARAYFRSTGA
jgi:hypothetical protein